MADFKVNYCWHFNNSFLVFNEFYRKQLYSPLTTGCKQGKILLQSDINAIVEKSWNFHDP